MKRVLPILAIAALIASATVLAPSRAQSPSADEQPIAPMIPTADREDQSRVFLERANTLRSAKGSDYQVLVGDVMFRRGGMLMYCDSAHYYDGSGSFDAFGNVRMEQGDTLFVYGDELNYNDSASLAVLSAYDNKMVRLINRDVTLRTVEFFYDLDLDLGYYKNRGELTDKQNKLTSIEGEYSPPTKEAHFQYDVHLTSLSDNDTLEIFTDNLLYNTDTHVAELTTFSRVISGDGVIETFNGVYNTETTAAELYDRSLVIASNGNTLTGDTLYYDRKQGRGEAFGNMELNDTTNKVILLGDYGYYDELIDSAFVTGRARAIEYSQKDSLYFHGDTIRAFRVIIQPDTATAAEPIIPAPADSISVLPDSISAPVDSIIVPPGDNGPILTGGPDIPKVLYDKIDSISAPVDSIITPPGDNGPILTGGPDIPKVLYDEIDSISAPADSIITPPGDNGPILTGGPDIPKVLYDEAITPQPDTIRYIIATPNVKFYRKDIQGLCDSLTFVSQDTMVYMDYRPVVWSDNRQILGDRINIHLNDSTIDWAKIPSGGFMAEEIEEGYYNQLSGKEMIALFVDGALSHLDVNGNVLAITFPEENDSTINKIMNIESSFLAADFKENSLERLKLWSQTNAVVTPLYLAKKSIFFLPQFKWFAQFRPDSPDDILIFSPELEDFLIEARHAAGSTRGRVYHPQAAVTTAETAEEAEATEESEASVDTKSPAVSEASAEVTEIPEEAEATEVVDEATEPDSPDNSTNQ